ncbi:MAG: helix-turn-helix domain-containing protein, partial [Pseudomonadota bacterium]
FFRLNVVNIVVPSLRERSTDIPLLAAHFVQKYAEANGVEECSIGDEAMAMLHAHTWRGNVRELENTMHRAVLLASGPEIEPAAILLTSQMVDDTAASSTSDSMTASAETVRTATAASSGGLVGQTVAEVEKSLILDTLKHTLGNRTHAANILGISIRTLRNKLKQYSEDGVAVPPPGDLERVLG